MYLVHVSVIKRLAATLMLVSICFCTAGCWDARELQERSFVLAAAVDAVNEQKEKGEQIEDRQVETFSQHSGTKRYLMSLQILKLTGSEGSETKGKRESKTFILSNSGQSLFEMVRDTLGQSSKSLYFEHIQAVVISDSALKEGGIQPIVDFFRRDPEMRWRIRVLITPGNARSVLEFPPPTGEPGGIFLAGIVRNHTRNLHVTGLRTDLGYLIQNLDNNKDYLLPRVIRTEKILKVGGAAVFKKDKFVGYIDEQAVAGAKLLFGSDRSGIITIKCKDHPNEVLAFEIFSHDTRLSVNTNGGDISYNLDITMRGNIGESGCALKHDVLSPQFLREAEIAFAEEVKRLVLYSHAMSQNMDVDYNQLGSKLKAHDPEAWERVKDRWYDILPTVPLNVSVNVSINAVGEHK